MIKYGKDINKFLFTKDIKEKSVDTENVNQKDARDEYLLKIIDEIYSDKNVEVKTDLNERQILAITRGQLFAERYNCDIMDKLCNKIMKLSISKNRLSRKEFTEISKSITEPSEMEAPPITMRQRLFNG